jgi:uncharacterized membrane protein YcaP (DUF421 family)
VVNLMDVLRSVFGPDQGSLDWVLVRDGQLDERTMRRAGISRTDLHEAARQAQVMHFSQVKRAVLERCGRISVLRREEVDGP